MSERTILRRLSRRERQALVHLSHGLRPKEAAQVLGISPYTFNDHTESARFKLGALTNAHAVAIAIKAGLLT